MKSIRKSLEDNSFSPAQEMINLYNELTRDKETLDTILAEHPVLISEMDPMSIQKVRERVLSSLMKATLAEDSNVLRMKQMRLTGGEEDIQAPVISYQQKRLPDGRVVIERSEVGREEGFGAEVTEEAVTKEVITFN